MDIPSLCYKIAHTGDATYYLYLSKNASFAKCKNAKCKFFSKKKQIDETTFNCLISIKWATKGSFSHMSVPALT